MALGTYAADGTVPLIIAPGPYAPTSAAALQGRGIVLEFPQLARNLAHGPEGASILGFVVALKRCPDTNQDS